MNQLPQTNRRKILCHSQEKMFEVIDVEDIGIFLLVVCGGIAMYNRFIKLEETEITAFHDTGESALYPLAYDVAKGRHKEREWTEGAPTPK